MLHSTDPRIISWFCGSQENIERIVTAQQRARAGVYGWKDGSEKHIKIRPSRPGPFHKINRAEMVAILVALKECSSQPDLVIAADSANMMKAISEQLDRPHEHKQHLHKYLLQALGDTLTDRAKQGLETSLKSNPTTASAGM